jgi:hypothetical protein
MAMPFASGLPNLLLLHRHFVTNIDAREQLIVVFHHISTLGLHELSPINQLQAVLDFGFDDGEFMRKELQVGSEEGTSRKNCQCFFHHSYNYQTTYILNYNTARIRIRMLLGRELCLTSARSFLGWIDL